MAARALCFGFIILRLISLSAALSALLAYQMMRTRLDRLTFRVPDASACRAFYQEMLGMSVASPCSDNSQQSNTMGYSESGLKLAFQDSPSCTVRQSTSSDAYWKIGIIVKNLDHVVGFLQLQGIPVSKPGQFLDIGYLCHLRDPAGLSIELLQQGFEGNEEQIISNNDDDHPIGSQATLAHITIRSNELSKIRTWSEKDMGMRLFSIQPVRPYGFSLYFYSWSNDVLPKPDDLEAVGNRPWLWARPYALLEIQHLEGGVGGGGDLRSTGQNEAGPIELLILDEESKPIIVDCRQGLRL